MVLVQKFYKQPITFRIITIGYYSYSNRARKELLHILNDIRLKISEECQTIFSKNSFVLIDKIKHIQKIYNRTYDSNDLFNNINIKYLKGFAEMYNIM